MTAEAIRDPNQPDSPKPPPGALREWRVRMIKRGVKLFFLILAVLANSLTELYARRQALR